MNTKTMEGLIGAGANIDLVNTPMRVFKEARRKGDTATMERAMGYANDFAGKAEEYKIQADEGTREEAKDSREKAEQEREKTIEKRRTEREKLAKELAARREEHRKSTEEAAESATGSETAWGAADKTGNAIDDIVDTVEISEAGKAALKEDRASSTPASQSSDASVSI